MMVDAYEITILETTRTQNARVIVHRRSNLRLLLTDISVANVPNRQWVFTEEIGVNKQSIGPKEHYVCAWHGAISIPEF